MEMRSGRITGAAHVADLLALLDVSADTDRGMGHVAVVGQKTVAVVDDHIVSVAAVTAAVVVLSVVMRTGIAGDGHPARGRSHDRVVPAAAGDVDAVVERAPAGAVSGGHVRAAPSHRPDERAGVGAVTGGGRGRQIGVDLVHVGLLLCSRFGDVVVQLFTVLVKAADVGRQSVDFRVEIALRADHLGLRFLLHGLGVFDLLLVRDQFLFTRFESGFRLLIDGDLVLERLDDLVVVLADPGQHLETVQEVPEVVRLQQDLEVRDIAGDVHRPKPIGIEALGGGDLFFLYRHVGLGLRDLFLRTGQVLVEGGDLAVQYVDLRVVGVDLRLQQVDAFLDGICVLLCLFFLGFVLFDLFLTRGDLFIEVGDLLADRAVGGISLDAGRGRDREERDDGKGQEKAQKPVPVSCHLRSHSPVL